MLESPEWISKPEAQLLLCCARTQQDAINKKSISALVQTGIDWNTLLQMAFHHRITPLLYRSLEVIAPARIPETVREKLKEQIQITIQGNLFLTKELLHLMDLFHEQGIQLLPYKGPVLSASIYGDLALRPSNDLDILVHERDILQAMHLVISCGYQIIRPSILARTRRDLQPQCVSQLVRKSPWAYQLVLWHPERKGLVELHWRILPKYIFPNRFEQIWEDLTPVAVGGSTVLSIAPENLLWFLCVHGGKHQWNRLNWICDIAELIRANPALNWEYILAQAAKLGVERRLLLGLLLANCLLKAPIPALLEARIHKSQQVKFLARQVIQQYYDDIEKPAPLQRMERFTFQLSAIDHLIDRGRYLLRFASGPAY
jgi:hypothetical protein